MQGAFSLDNSIGAEIHGGGTVDLIALLKEVPIVKVRVISPSRIVRITKEIIFTLRLAIKCSINCISLFNVIFLYC